MRLGTTSKLWFKDPNKKRNHIIQEDSVGIFNILTNTYIFKWKNT